LGGALKLLQASGIPEAKDYAAFPVGGSFLVTDKPEITSRHLAKAYGKASVGSPPMSVPHLDTRVLDGKKVLLFGPFATFSTKSLKEGSLLDLFSTVRPHNIGPMLRVGVDEYPLVEYLAGQLMLSDDDRYQALKEYFPQAQKEDWRLWQAGQREIVPSYGTRLNDSPAKTWARRQPPLPAPLTPSRGRPGPAKASRCKRCK